MASVTTLAIVYVRKLLPLSCAVLVIFLFQNEILEQLWSAGVSQRGAPRVLNFGLLAGFLLVNIIVLAFALKPSRGLWMLGGGGFKERLMGDMDAEQQNMPEFFSTLRTAQTRPDQAKALRHLSALFVLLFLIPVWWSFFIESRVAEASLSGCTRTLSWFEGLTGLTGLPLLRARVDCARFSAVMGNIVGGSVLFVGAMFFRSRFQIALRGFARFQRR